MKKTCNGCRALEYGLIHNYCWECSLGYDIDSTKGIPNESCPKPRTIAELVRLGKHIGYVNKFDLLKEGDNNNENI